MLDISSLNQKKYHLLKILIPIFLLIFPTIGFATSTSAITPGSDYPFLHYVTADTPVISDPCVIQYSTEPGWPDTAKAQIIEFGKTIGVPTQDMGPSFSGSYGIKVTWHPEGHPSLPLARAGADGYVVSDSTGNKVLRGGFLHLYPPYLDGGHQDEVILHELGHIFNLDHNYVEYDGLMWYQMKPITYVGVTRWSSWELSALMLTTSKMRDPNTCWMSPDADKSLRPDWITAHTTPPTAPPTTPTTPPTTPQNVGFNVGVTAGLTLPSTGVVYSDLTKVLYRFTSNGSLSSSASSHMYVLFLPPELVNPSFKITTGNLSCTNQGQAKGKFSADFRALPQSYDRYILWTCINSLPQGYSFNPSNKIELTVNMHANNTVAVSRQIIFFGFFGDNERDFYTGQAKAKAAGDIRQAGIDNLNIKTFTLPGTSIKN